MTDFLHPLGHKENTYYYISSSNGQIISLSPEKHNEMNFYSIMPQSYWNKYLNENTSKIEWKRAAAELMLACREKGIFDASRVRGIGVWKDGDHYLINLGDGLYENGVKGPSELKGSKYIYEIGQRIPEPISPLARSDYKDRFDNFDSQALIRVCKLINWDNPLAYRYLVGWLVVAPVAGALEWRPHCWLIGPPGGGKTWLAENLIRPFIETLGIHIQGTSTEAGIRQTIAASSRPVLFDEAESTDEHSGKRMQYVIELFRQASSTGGGQVVKGSPSGTALNFRVVFAGFLSSVRSTLIQESDRGRFTELELGRKTETSDEKFDQLVEEIKKITPEYIETLFSRTFRNLPLLVETIKVFQNTLRRKHTARVGQQYGALLGGYWSLLDNYDVDSNMRLCDRVPTQAEADKLCADIVPTIETEQREEMECFEHLMGLQVEVAVTEAGHKQQHSIENLVGRAWRDFNDSAVGPLERIGIRVHEGHLYVRNKHPELAKLYRGTKWGTNWASSLKRLPGGVKKTVSLGGGSYYCAIVPLDGLLTPF